MGKYSFWPEVFYNVFGGHEPVLSLSPGDTVTTSTVDAHGIDAGMSQVAERPNPLTGPFFIERAEPGDTLIVRIDRLFPNRSSGWSATSVSRTVVDPSFVDTIPDKEYAEWKIDLKKKMLRLHHPASGVSNIEFQLAPMLGCIGVAPSDGQKLSSMTSAEHGGNMDYSGCREGTRLYLPVYTEGALLYIGDGHALQGDGELGSTGVEVSMDVEFTVELVKRKKIGWPRGEDEQFMFTMGNARPFDQALQHAITEMIRWLLDDFHLDIMSTHLLMGQCVRFEVANFYDPAYTAVCKLQRSLVQKLK